MIGRLTGTLADCSPDLLLVEVAGVGYEVQIPLGTFYALSGRSGETVRLHVHTHVREDAIQLFGFASPDERVVFERLIGISGVGPKLALAILSGIGVDELRGAVAGRDRVRLEKIPGVGRKTAERLLLELRDRLDLEPTGTATGQTGAPVGLRDDALSALVNLGYPVRTAERAIEAAIEAEGHESTIEALLRRALARLAR